MEERTNIFDVLTDVFEGDVIISALDKREDKLVQRNTFLELEF